MKAPVSSIVEPDIPGVGLNKVEVVWIAGNGIDAGGAGLTGQPVILTGPCAVIIEVVVDGEEDRGEPKDDEDDDDF